MEILIAEVRKAKKISLRKLSKLCGIPPTKLFEYENGIFSPRLNDLESIAVALNVRISDLYHSVYK